MRIGLFVTGHFRKPIPFDQFSVLTDNHDVDVYALTWDRADNRKDHPSDNAMYISGDINSWNVKDFFRNHLKKCFVVNTDFWPINRKFEFKPITRENDVFHPNNIHKSRVQSFDNPWGMDIPQRILDQFNLVHMCYKLCNLVDYDNYDLVIKIRFDNVYNAALDINDIGERINFDNSNAGYAETYNEQEPDLIPYTLSDRVAWGKPHWMRKYFEFGPNIWTMYERDNVDISYSENLLARWILKYPYFRTDGVIPDVEVKVHNLRFPLTDGR